MSPSALSDSSLMGKPREVYGSVDKLLDDVVSVFAAR